MKRTTARALIVLSLLSFAVPAHAAEPREPSALRAVVNVTGHRYEDNTHYASGRLRLNNSSGHGMNVDCRVTLTWRRGNGDTAKRHRDLDNLHVGAGEIRKVHWHMMFKDPDHLFLNTPSNAAAHCHN